MNTDLHFFLLNLWYCQIKVFCSDVCYINIYALGRHFYPKKYMMPVSEEDKDG